MSVLARLRSWLRGARNSAALMEDMAEEFRDHMLRRAADLEAAGVAHDEAVRRARVEFGSIDRYREEGREARGLRLLDEIAQDVRYATRMLLRNPSFSAVAVFTLAIGVGATTAIFSAVQGVLLRPLPYPAPERLVAPRTLNLESGDDWSITYGDYETWRRDGVFEHVGLYNEVELNVSGIDTPERIDAVRATDGFFAAIGVAPQLGHTFTAEDFDLSSARRVVISDGFWQRRFGGAPDVIGRTLRITGVPYEIVGVLPPRGGYPAHADLWLPLRVEPADLAWMRRMDNFIFTAIARLAPGRSLEATRERLAELAEGVAQLEPVTRGDVSITAVPLNTFLVGQNTTRALWIFLAAVGLVLLIGCVNVANLLLARAATRGRELAIRGSIGASRARITRQLFTESLLLGVTGGIAGAVLAYFGTRALIMIAPPDAPRIGDVRVDMPVLLFALAVSVAATIVFGLAPALRAARASLATSVMDADRRSTTGVRGRRERNVLVAAELAVSLVLLVGAGLQLRSLAQLRNTDPGFDTAQLLTFSMGLQGEAYADPALRAQTYLRVLERLRATPGVENAAAASSMPLGADGFYLGRVFLAEGRPEPPAGDEVAGQWIAITPGYFATMQIPMLRGRAFLDSDIAAATPVMIVNREFARRMFPDEEPLGKRVRSWRDENLYREIVGITDDVRFFAAGDSIRPLVYVPHAQDTWTSMVVAVRTARSNGDIVPALRSAVREIDNDIPIDDVQGMEQVHAASVAPTRFSAYLLTGFAIVALLLAVVGTYGVFAYGVSQRRREIGIRMALGARRANVLGMVLREALLVVGVAVTIGMGVSLVVSRVLRALLFQVSPTDPVVFFGVPALLVGVALGASLIPARQAARIDPNETMRS
jgi:putative ABC transport system permease protein